MFAESLFGAAAITEFLKRSKIEGVRIDRDERHLQAESVGLIWRPESAYSDKFEASAKALSPEKRDAAWDAYLKDPRDTATPVGMADFLKALASGHLLSKASTQKLLAVMTSTATGRDRLRAGTPSGWTIGHKTGTGRAWKGMTAATIDVGILTAPDWGKNRGCRLCR